MLLSAEEITKNYGVRTILDHVTLHLEYGKKVGVIGINGMGKSTLLRILAGEEEPETGSITCDPHVRIAYLAQNPAYDPENTVIEQVFAGLPSTVRETEEYEAKAILNRLSIPDISQKMKTLSGGQRKRTALASVLIHPCDLLILDEPTNHLDDTMIDWLENHLRRMKTALLMITHDRYFLERVVEEIIEIEYGKLRFYEGNYDKYLQRKAEQLEMAAASERKRQSILRREYQWVMQGAKARGTKSRDRLERYEALKNQEKLPEKQTLTLSAMSSRLGKKTIALSGVTKAFDGRTVLRDFDCILLRNDRIGIVGANGSGKSTLLNLIAGRLSPDAGEIVRGETVRIGYFSQENPPMDDNQRVIDFVKDIGNHIETPDGVLTASQLLEKFLFPGESQWRPIGKLSGGEKRRLFLLSVLASAPNVLLLDEPTNDLDIETLTILEDYLDTFPGAVITVSHDRYFLDRVVQRVFAVEPDGTVQAYAGGYTEYWEQLQNKPEEKKPKAPEKTRKPSRPQKLRFSYKEQREYDTIDADIEDLHTKIAENQAAQTAQCKDYVALQTLQEEQTQLEQQLEEKMERWLYLTDLAERIAAQNAGK